MGGRSYMGVLVFRLYEQLLSLRDGLRGGACNRHLFRTCVKNISNSIIDACFYYSLAAQMGMTSDMLHMFLSIKDDAKGAGEEAGEEADTGAGEVVKKAQDQAANPEAVGKEQDPLDEEQQPV